MHTTCFNLTSPLISYHDAKPGPTITSDFLFSVLYRPNLGDQPGLLPRQATQVWIDVIRLYRKLGAHYIHPVTTSAPMGIGWMQQFLDGCYGRSLVSVCVFVCVLPPPCLALLPSFRLTSWYRPRRTTIHLILPAIDDHIPTTQCT